MMLMILLMPKLRTPPSNAIISITFCLNGDALDYFDFYDNPPPVHVTIIPITEIIKITVQTKKGKRKKGNSVTGKPKAEKLDPATGIEPTADGDTTTDNIEIPRPSTTYSRNSTFRAARILRGGGRQVPLWAI